jgi:hypothetical protein
MSKATALEDSDGSHDAPSPDDVEFAVRALDGDGRKTLKVIAGDAWLEVFANPRRRLTVSASRGDGRVFDLDDDDDAMAIRAAREFTEKGILTLAGRWVARSQTPS